MNEKRIEQVLEIEQQAQNVLNAAMRDAEQLPARAEQEAQAMIAQAKADAEAEARKVVEAAQSEDRASDIVAGMTKTSSDAEAKAKANFDKAVTYVLERVIGRV
jgi:V/A-type H+-transporting ATPase subunit G/H/F-type H+-transporting ATPase subunit b